MKQYEFSAKSVQEAINKGLKELNQKQEDVDIKIISEGGLFSKAKILIITEEVEEVKEVKQPEPVKEVKPVKVEKKGKQSVLAKTELKQDKKELKNTPSQSEKQAVMFVRELAKKLNSEIEIETSEDDENLKIEMNGQNAGNLIGYRGEGLNAIQYLANVIENNAHDKENHKRIVLNIENYKEKREEALISLAKRIAKKVERTGKYQRLEPMNAYERLIIHTALADEPVKTYSKGEEPHRYLIIEPK